MKPTHAEPTTSNPPEDKCAKLAAFVARALNGRGTGSVVTVVARSAASPVAEALVQVGRTLADHGVQVRAIFTTLTAEPGRADWTNSATMVPFARDVRWARHPRMSEAHEQLVVGNEACWIGDCMRRDPAKRDAYEQFLDCNPDATRVATVSFERLWQLAEPVGSRTIRVNA
jgi:hypothetical protein